MSPIGLDMYLYAEVKAPKDSPLAKVIEENLEPEHVAQMDAKYDDDPDYENSAYVSGWTYSDNKPERLYDALCTEIGFIPHPGSPHFEVFRDGEGYRIAGTLFYWRKSNMIHNWFVEEVQGGVDDCGSYEVHSELLLDLIERCETITVDHSRTDLLTPVAGFFFGSTEIDEWYFDDIRRTAEGLKAQISMLGGRSVCFKYHSSW